MRRHPCALASVGTAVTVTRRREATRLQRLPADWPAAFVAQGSLASQRVVCATLATLAAEVEREGLRSPCLTIVGEVARLRDELAWFGEHGPGAAIESTLCTTVEA